MLIISPQLLGRGFVQLIAGEQLRSSDQFFDPDPQTGGWKMSTAFTSDKRLNLGRSPYRRAMTWRAKLSILVPLVQKYWRRLRS